MSPPSEGESPFHPVPTVVGELALDADRLSNERLLQLIELAVPDDSPPREKEQQ